VVWNAGGVFPTPDEVSRLSAGRNRNTIYPWPRRITRSSRAAGARATSTGLVYPSAAHHCFGARGLGVPFHEDEGRGGSGFGGPTIRYQGGPRGIREDGRLPLEDFFAANRGGAAPACDGWPICGSAGQRGSGPCPKLNPRRSGSRFHVPARTRFNPDFLIQGGGDSKSPGVTAVCHWGGWSRTIVGGERRGDCQPQTRARPPVWVHAEPRRGAEGRREARQRPGRLAGPVGAGPRARAHDARRALS